MVNSLPEQLRDDIRNAEDVFTAFVGIEVTEGDSAGDENNNLTAFGDDKPAQITFGTDVEVLAGLVITDFIPEVAATGQGPPSVAQTGAATLQWSTRNNYADSGGDGDLAAGLLYEEYVAAIVPLMFEDEGNSTGGGAGGVSAHKEKALSQEAIETESTVEMDEGTDVAAHMQVESVPTNDTQLLSQLYLWVRER